ncbi:MAG: DEAD/DEAH box helicase [Candidatus Tenebribacter burtonii]|nr:DEAD/DEAH box helicase [Candidatus Tenebribacter burtonii]
MARLFGKEYHENSNSWFFKSSLIRLMKDDLIFNNYLDENKNVVFRFEAVPAKKYTFPAKLEILYNKKNGKILDYSCSECDDKECRHYLSIIKYAYNFLSTDMLEKSSVQTYYTSLLDYNEFWQRTVLNAKIEISDIYNNKTDKIRFNMMSYKPLLIRVIACICADGDFKEDDIVLIPQAEKQMKALSSEELELLRLLYKNKCSFSRKGTFFTIYKHKFINIINILKNMQNKVYIKETGDNIKFSDDEFRINFQVSRYESDKYILKISNAEQISAVFPGKTTYIFIKNVVNSINLPFKISISKKIFANGYILKRTDLVYLYSVVARQLGLMKCYLDFDEDIEIPKVYHNTPVITYKLFKENESIILNGILDYSNGNEIPMSAIRFPVELVRYDQEGEVTWFYIPPQIKYEILNFVNKLPESKTHQLEENSQLIFEGQENIDTLKEIIFENADPSWNIQLSGELKKEFVYKVDLKPVIKTKQTKRINWFEYDVEYNYKDLKFTHQELKEFFDTKEKFLKLEDGRLLYFENKNAFLEIEKLINKSKKTPSEAFKLSIYNLPYVYQLNTINSGIKIEGDSYLEEMFTAILKRRLDERTPITFILRPVMRSYQKAGYHWMKMLERFGLSGILADEMGLGKTIQSISVLSDLPTDSKSLIICPKTLLFNWAAEINKFNKSLSYILYEGNQKERKQILENLNVNLLFASYSIIQNDIENLSEIEFDYIILDEAQHIKNPSALRTKAVKKLKAKHRCALSGTPIENNPTELWSIFDFLMPGYLPKSKNFINKFKNNSVMQKESNDKLKMLVSPFILRRKKNDVLIELPDKQVQQVYCKLTSVQEKMYLQILENVKNRYLDTENVGNSYLHILAALTKLRQICNHPHLVDKDLKKNIEFSGKLELLREIIVDAVQGGKKLLIFSQFVQMLKILREMLKEEKITYEYMDGSVKNRQKVIDNFNNNNNIRTFLISLKTGGYGLNLTSADTVIIVDPWWNPMGENQAIDRAHRIGQTKKVMVYKIITKGTIEEKILGLQQNKKMMFENIIEQGQNVIKKMDAEQLRKLLEY